jgi:hypothetical protein
MDLPSQSGCSVLGGQPHGPGGVRRGAQGMRTHVRDCCGLPGRSGGSGRWRGAHLTCAGEPAADLFCDIKLAAAEGPRSLDCSAWADIAWNFRLEQPKHSLRAISGPHGNDSPFGLAQRLR